MSDIIAVAQRKGGVGKTTLSISLAAELRRRGRNIALVDSDPQASACHWAQLGNLEFPVYELALADQAVPRWVRDVRTVSADCVVIDTAPGDRALGASIALANLVVVPCTPSSLDLDATMRTLEIIDAVRIRRGGYPNMILVPNRVDVRTLEGRQLLEELVAFGETVSPTIGDRVPFVRAASAGRYVAEEPGGAAAHREIERLCDVVEKFLATASREVRT